MHILILFFFIFDRARQAHTGFSDYGLKFIEFQEKSCNVMTSANHLAITVNNLNLKCNGREKTDKQCAQYFDSLKQLRLSLDLICRHIVRDKVPEKIKKKFHNEVDWRKDQCFDCYANGDYNNVCPPNSRPFHNKKYNKERYIGFSCECNDKSIESDGFRCVKICGEGVPLSFRRTCLSQLKECQVNHDNRPICGCPRGTKLIATADGNGYCRRIDECKTCRHKCHKASKCMPPTLNSDLGYSCAKCDPRKGYVGDGFTCKDVDECSDWRLNQCDIPNAKCINKEPIYDNNLKYICECKEGWRTDPHAGYTWRKCIDTDECKNSSACGRHTKCVNTPGSYYCECLPGFRKAPGDLRSCVDIDECLELKKPCHDKAICINRPGSYQCKCKEGFHGKDPKKYCQPDKDYWCRRCDVRSTICLLNDLDDGYYCKCKNGYEQIAGNHYKCRDILECLVPSLNKCDKTPGHSVCIELPGSYKCECAKGYEGDGIKCTPIDPCLRPNRCGKIPGVFCVNRNGKAVCECKKGFVRKLDEINDPWAPCYDIHSNVVNNCSICDNRTQQCQRIRKGLPYFECVCRRGYQMNSAGFCENVNECRRVSENDCDPNAICVDREPAIHNVYYECRCKKGYQGNGRIGHCTDVNECEVGVHGHKACPHPNQHCVNTVGSYECRCNKGYRFITGSQQCVNIDECEEGKADCPIHSKCLDKSPGFICVCLRGFEKDRDNRGKDICRNVDECKIGIIHHGQRTSACDSQNGICIDTIGSYHCTCKNGFYLDSDGRTCRDKDECKEGEDNCNKQVHLCVNTFGSYKCVCKKGLIEKHGRCEDRDECADGSHECHKDSNCVNMYASYRCECRVGFEPIFESHPLRPKCKRENVCVKRPGLCQPGRCISIPNPPYFRCRCTTRTVPFRGDTLCVEYDYCDNECLCPRFTKCVANRCVVDLGYLWPEPTVFPITPHNLCNRPDATEIDPCKQSQPCRRPLKCKHTGPGEYECVCQQGFEKVGNTCIDIDECKAMECPPNAQCVNTRGGFRCDCLAGFSPQVGSSSTLPKCIDIDECQQGTDECYSRNGDCVNTIGSYQCKCRNGYSLQAPDFKTCRDINECRTGIARCHKNAECINRPGTYTCRCRDGFVGNGIFCEDVNECDPLNRLDNCNDKLEICQNTEGSFRCVCKKGYIKGHNGCQDVDECKSSSLNTCHKYGGIVKMKCYNLPGTFTCRCPKGYYKVSKYVCGDVDECKQSPPVCPTGEGDVCVNKPGSYSCECQKGFEKPADCSDEAVCPCVDINECKRGVIFNGLKRKACAPNALCTNTFGSYRCKCRPGYDGDPYLEGCKILDVCLVANPCDKISQDCHNVNRKAVCVCKSEFIKVGKNCRKNPCLWNNGGCGKLATCRPWVSRGQVIAQCICPNGMELDSRKNCVPIDRCKCERSRPGEPCKSDYECKARNMLCLNVGIHFRCVCRKGYKLSDDGRSCININECEEGVDGRPACEPKAVCFDTIGSYICECPRGQIENHEHRCQPDTEDCSREENCVHDENAICVLIDPWHRHCKCKKGYIGEAKPRGPPCEEEDHCAKARSLCPRHSKCVNIRHGYKCVCDKGFESESPNGECRDINECSRGLADCHETFVCKNTIGSYECVCPRGYRLGPTRERCLDINECRENRKLCRIPRERCVNLPGGYRCECNTPWFIKSQRGCIDNNECEGNQYDCPLYSKCQNLIGNYNCTCMRGFYPSRIIKRRVARCDDIDECALSKDACPPSARCRNLIGSYECICIPPAIQNGPQDCVVNASCPQRCHRHAYCLKSERRNGEVYNCTCHVGYEGDGVHRCDPINECESGTAKCHKDAECIDKTPLYECRCRWPFFEGDGVDFCNPVNPCDKLNDCPIVAQCIPLKKPRHGKYVTCKCPRGFLFDERTRLCKDIDECETNGGLGPCSRSPPGIRCINTQGSYYCKCPKGFILDDAGERCVDVDECQSYGIQVCNRGRGECKNLIGSFECVCKSGFRQDQSRRRCIDIDECEERLHDCDRHTTKCVNTIGSFRCLCIPGYTHVPGKKHICEDLDECLIGTHNCHNSENCYNIKGGYACNCSFGYRKVRDRCVPEGVCTKECGANALCVMRRDRNNPSKLIQECVCQDGFYGENPNEFCDPVPDCSKDSQCPANSRCVETQTTKAHGRKGRASYICLCNNGYEKRGSQCFPIDHCSRGDICGRHSVCVHWGPSYKCVCKEGSVDVGFGRDNVTCVPIRCESNPDLCHSDAICKNTADGYVCECRSGFRGPGTRTAGCYPIDWCEEVIPCSQYATCVNFPRGSYTCRCLRGYEGNGTICRDINECERTHGKACDRHATCVNTQGSFICRCKPGYEGSGLPGQCRDIDECNDERLNLCDLSTTICRNTEGSFECKCKNGYERGANKYSCLDINECEVNPKICGIHRCNNLPGDYRCVCNPGFVSVDRRHRCEDVNECESKPCHANAHCANTPGSYICSCREGYEGDGRERCSPIDKCSKPDLNQCDKKTTKCEMIKGHSSYRCVCLKGYGPPRNYFGMYYVCQDIDECRNGMVVYDPHTEDCINMVPGYKIKCKHGYRRNKEGFCEDIDECKEDEAYIWALERYKESRKKRFLLPDWRQWLPKPKNPTSAYAICYEYAMSKPRYHWIDRSTVPLPFCRNTLYDPRGAFAGHPSLRKWKGFQCDCPPGFDRVHVGHGDNMIFKCEEQDVCRVLDCSKNGQGFVCDRKRRMCVCDFSKGYVMKSASIGRYCTLKECENVDSIPTCVKNIEHRQLISCDLKTKRWKKVRGYNFFRDNQTNEVCGLIDINECADEHYCCNRSRAECGINRVCKAQCHNFDGGAACYCNKNNPDVDVDRDTCECKSKCKHNSAWYLNCHGDRLTCNMAIWEKLAKARTAPRGVVCSRISSLCGEYLEFSSILELVKELCRTKSYCLMPPEPIDDIRRLPAFNYEGKCILDDMQLDSVKCPFGDRPKRKEGQRLYAFCPYKFEMAKYPPVNPEIPKHLKIYLECLKGQRKPSENTLFFQVKDNSPYQVEEPEREIDE